MQVHDLTGQTFGKLTVVDRAPNNKRNRAMWNCVCQCGRSCLVLGSNLIQGKTHSCGCMVRKHGKARKERLYNIWKGMRQRCRDTNSKDYKNYGGRGIRVCQEWNDYLVFREWALTHGYSDSLTIDRIDNNRDYEPSNCRWASYQEQNNNLRSNSIVTYKGMEMTIAQLARMADMPYKLVLQRLSRGWTAEMAVTRPNQKEKKNHAIT